MKNKIKYIYSKGLFALIVNNIVMIEFWLILYGKLDLTYQNRLIKTEKS